MDNRKSSLIDELKKNKIVDVDLFLKKHAVSFRTLKNDVAYLNSELEAEILELNKSVICVKDLPLFLKQLTVLKKQANPFTYKMSKKERLFIELLFIFNNLDYTTGNDLAEKLFISRNTVTNDISQLKKELRDNKLDLESKTNKGYKVVGDEGIVRQLIYQKIMDSWSQLNEEYRQIITATLNFSDSQWTELKVKLVTFFDEYGITLEDNQFSAFLCCVGVKQKRMEMSQLLKGKKFNDPDNQLLLQNFFNQMFLNTNWRSLGELNDLKILFQFLDMKEKFSEGTQIYADDQIKISSFVWEVCKDLDILEEIEYENYEILCAHIMSTVENIKKGISSQKNPINDELKALYPDIFEVVHLHISLIEKMVDREINENDITYIVMHVAVIMENHNNYDRKLRIALVCPNGRCVSMFLKNRLLTYFNVEIKDTVPAYKLDAQKGIDLVVSTIPIETSKFPVVVVNQMLLPSDMRRIRKYMREINKKADKTELHQNIENYVEGYQYLLTKNACAEDLKELNDQYREMDRPFFFNQLKREQLILDFDTRSWQTAVRTAGELLRDKEYVNQQYVDSMVEIVEENGPYILFLPGFAIAHAAPEDGANKLGVSLIRMKKPLNFEGSEIDIKVIVCLSIPDEQSHVFLLYQIYKCLTNETLFNELIACKTKDQLLENLRAYELAQLK